MDVRNDSLPLVRRAIDADGGHLPQAVVVGEGRGSRAEWGGLL